MVRSAWMAGLDPGKEKGFLCPPAPSCRLLPPHPHPGSPCSPRARGASWLFFPIQVLLPTQESRLGRARGCTARPGHPRCRTPDTQRLRRAGDGAGRLRDVGRAGFGDFLILPSVVSKAKPMGVKSTQTSQGSLSPGGCIPWVSFPGGACTVQGRVGVGSGAGSATGGED